MFKNNSFISRYNFQIPLIYITLFFIHFSVKETIIKCEFDKESALGTLLNSPIGGGRKEDPKSRGHSKVRPKPTKSSPPPEENLANIGAHASKNPILITPEIPKIPKIIHHEPSQQTFKLPAADEMFTTPTTLPIKKANRIDIRSRSPSPTVSTPG